ncbi:MAG: rhodanese-like domain-containing protein [Bacteroidota bacterium]
MQVRKTFFATVLIAISLFLAFTSVFVPNNEIEPENLVRTLERNENYYSVDKVAEQLISNDPLLQLVDVRSEEEFSKFSLPGAVNVPLGKLLDEANQDYVNQEVYNTVFYSNGSTDAMVALMVATRKGYKNNYIMRGGLNEWVEKILRPKYEGNFDVVNDELYQFRKGAQAYFGGGSATPAADASAPKPKKKAVKREKKAVSGGCG